MALQGCTPTVVYMYPALGWCQDYLSIVILRGMKEELTVVLGDLERRFRLFETRAGEHELFHTA